MGSKPTEGRAANNASTRVEILKSAAIAFRRLGYHGATVEQIAAALQMKKGNLYYYYKNKEEILLACHQYSLDRLLALLEEVEQSDAAPDEKLSRLIVSFVHTILDELHGTALFLDLEALTAPHRKLVIARRDQFDHGMRRVIEDGVRTGVFGQHRRETALVCHSRRGQLDPALVPVERPFIESGDRRSVRGLSGRRVTANLTLTEASCRPSGPPLHRVRRPFEPI